MEKIKAFKTHILIAVYALLIIVELFYYVPYNNIQIFRSKENVARTVIVGSGYTTIDEITKDTVCFDEKNIYSYMKPSEVGKIVNTSQLTLNVSITTILAIAIYFLFQKNKRQKDKEAKEIPILDINALAFADEETIEKAQREYAEKMAEYLK
jgi:hypothetical protein